MTTPPDPALAQEPGESAFTNQDGFYQILLDAIPYPLIFKDAKGHYLGCNRAFLATQTPGRSDILGLTVHDILPPAEALEIDRRDRALLRSGGNVTFVAKLTTLSRGPRDMVVFKAVFQGPGGVPGGIITSILDVTERITAERALQESQSLLSTITSHVTDLIGLVDRQGRRIYRSPSYQTTLGYSAEQLLELTTMELVYPEDQPLAEEAFGRVFEDRVPQSLECRLRHRDGRCLPFEIRVTPVPGPAQDSIRALWVARDISERKAEELRRAQMEVQLRHAQRLESIGSLAAGIAHEINTPTQYIGDNTSFLVTTLPGLLSCLGDARRLLLGLREAGTLPAAGAGLLEAIEGLDLDYLGEEIPKALRQTLDGVARVAAIVGAMKDFSHPGGEGKSMVNLNKTIESTLTVSRNEWKYVARLETDLDPDLPRVPCLQGEINQAFLNLVVNAAHAIEERLGGRHTGSLGTIRVTTRVCGREAMVAVSDDGTGIPKAIQERIFEPFFTTKPVGRGTGQGLAIVHGVVVEKHGGRVALETEEGRGSTFRIFLPLDE